MGGLYMLLSISCILLTSRGVRSYVEALAGTVDTPATHFEPQVAMLCDDSTNNNGKMCYHNQFMSEPGRWVTDFDAKATCRRDKVEILEYCKKVYQKRDITNIVESNHYVKIRNWCKVGHKKCKATRWVKPYRCLEGPFQSDALLVPEHCLFDHIHNQTNCWEFDQWNQTAARACKEREMVLNSFAMLLPCGIDVFSGVEFVCCPKHYKDSKWTTASDMDVMVKEEKVKLQVTQVLDNTPSDNEDSGDDEDDDDDDIHGDSDEDDEDDLDEEKVSADTVSTSTTPNSFASSSNKQIPVTSTRSPPIDPPTPDPYFTHFDPRVEHQAFKDAEQRLEEIHKEKITKVMKDWSDLEERYQEMHSTDPKAAEEFKKKMTLSFQKTVQSLEEEGNAEKRQLVAMHQQRVMAHINERKKEAMTCYTEALNDMPNPHRVQKCLQKLLRSLHKDRHHTVAHYRHLLNTNFEQAERERDLTLEHLVDIDKMVNQSLQMLSSRFPELSAKIRQLMEDYATALRSKDDTPGSLLERTRESETRLLARFRSEVMTRMQEKEKQRQLERERKAQRQHERQEQLNEQRRVENNAGGKNKLGRPFDPESMEDESLPAMGAIPAIKQEAVQPKVAHVQTHSLSHEASYSVQRQVYHRENKSIYFTLAFAGIALMAAMIVGIVVLRRRHSHLPQSQGFVEVDQAATPEERHVANMQINGYENPTYKYFEAKE